MYLEKNAWLRTTFAPWGSRRVELGTCPARRVQSPCPKPDTRQASSPQTDWRTFWRRWFWRKCCMHRFHTSSLGLRGQGRKRIASSPGLFESSPRLMHQGWKFAFINGRTALKLVFVEMMEYLLKKRWPAAVSVAALQQRPTPAAARSLSIPIPPNTIIQMKTYMTGAKKTPRMNSPIVRPFDILAMNMPTNQTD